MKIKTWRDPYEYGFSTTKPTEIELNPGLTVLVGCNGAGKTTLLQNIKEEMKKQNIPCHLYNNLTEGGSLSISAAISSGQIALGANLWTASEGEAIKINLNMLSTKFDRFLEDGFFDTQKNRIAEIFRKTDEEKPKLNNKRVLLFDAVDSGLSVDSIVELKLVFDMVIKKAKELNIELYLIISANEYELARHSECFDVNMGTYITFKDYEDYRQFIIKSRTRKEKRIEQSEIWVQKRKEKEIKKYINLRTKAEEKKSVLLEKFGDKPLSWSDKHKLSDIDYKLTDYLNECRFLGKEEAEKIWSQIAD